MVGSSCFYSIHHQQNLPGHSETHPPPLKSLFGWKNKEKLSSLLLTGCRSLSSRVKGRAEGKLVFPPIPSQTLQNTFKTAFNYSLYIGPAASIPMENKSLLDLPHLWVHWAGMEAEL